MANDWSKKIDNPVTQAALRKADNATINKITGRRMDGVTSREQSMRMANELIKLRSRETVPRKPGETRGYEIVKNKLTREDYDTLKRHDAAIAKAKKRRESMAGVDRETEKLVRGKKLDY